MWSTWRGVNEADADSFLKAADSSRLVQIFFRFVQFNATLSGGLNTALNIYSVSY